MNDVDRMKIVVEGLHKRVRELEVLFETKTILNDDEREAQRIAEQLGFKVDVVVLKAKQDHASGRARRTIARELRLKKKWSIPRIARTLHICERTAERLVEA